MDAAVPKAETKIEKAIAFIRSKGSVRTPELAEHLGIPDRNVMPLLHDTLEKGYLASCLVEIPGRRPINEYKLSALVSESKITWAEYRTTARSQPRPLRTKSLPVLRGTTVVSTARAPIPPSSLSTPEKAVTPAEPFFARASDHDKKATPTAHTPAPTPEPETPRQRAVFMIDSNGQLRMELDDKTILFSNEETRDVGELLVASETIWS